MHLEKSIVTLESGQISCPPQAQFCLDILQDQKAVVYNDWITKNRLKPVKELASLIGLARIHTTCICGNKLNHLDTIPSSDHPIT